MYGGAGGKPCQRGRGSLEEGRRRSGVFLARRDGVFELRNARLGQGVQSKSLTIGTSFSTAGQERYRAITSASVLPSPSLSLSR